MNRNQSSCQDLTVHRTRDPQPESVADSVPRGVGRRSPSSTSSGRCLAAAPILMA